MTNNGIGLWRNPSIEGFFYIFFLDAKPFLFTGFMQS